MSDWGKGYVTDLQYSDEFFPQLSPQFLAFVATLNGFEPPDLSRGFAYCELGCGKGMTSSILAAASPEAEFHAVDFNPAHIAHARARAQAAQLSNITFHECSFEELSQSNGPALPMFDVVTMHGVWSWVSPEMQQAIVEFLAKRVKPGGLVHVSYNVMPSWLMVGPLQRLLKELADLSTGSSDLAVRNAFAMLERLAESGIIPEALRDTIKQITTGILPDNMVPYLAHEYLNKYWKPVYHADVVRDFAAAKLAFACSADPLKSFSNLHLNERQQTLLAEIAAPEVRETIADFASNRGIRTDVFVRGARHLSQRRRDALLGAIRLALLRVPSGPIELPGPDQTLWRADPDAYGAFMAALERRPHTVAELLAFLPSGHGVTPAELVGVLVGTATALPFEEAGPTAREACRRFNGLIEAEGEIPVARVATLAVAPLHIGVSLSSVDFDVYLALRRGTRPDPRALARRFVARCKAQSLIPRVDGRELPNEAEAYQALTSDLEMKIERVAPLWVKAGIMETLR